MINHEKVRSPFIDFYLIKKKKNVLLISLLPQNTIEFINDGRHLCLCLLTETQSYLAGAETPQPLRNSLSLQCSSACAVVKPQRQH